MDIEALKTTFTELGYNFNDELDMASREAESFNYRMSPVFDGFVQAYLCEQPGVIPFSIGRQGELELIANKGFHYENSPILYKLIAYMLRRGIQQVRPLGQGTTISTEEYLQQLESSKVKVTLPRYYYHGTSSKNFDSIVRKGLLPAANKSNFAISHSNKVFLTTDLRAAKGFALNAAENVFHARNDHSLYEEHEPIIFKIDSRLLDPAKVVMDYDLYLQYRRNNTIKGYDEFIDKAVSLGKTFADMKTKVKDSFDPALLYKVGYAGRITPASLVSVIYYTQELSLEEAREKLLRR